MASFGRRRKFKVEQFLQMTVSCEKNALALGAFPYHIAFCRIDP
jgi:hypothetical protein